MGQQKAWGSFEVMPRTWCLISALGADYLQLLAVIDCDVISQEVTERDMVSTIQPELPSFELLEHLPQSISILVCILFCISHDGHLLCEMVLTSKGLRIVLKHRVTIRYQPCCGIHRQR